FVITPSPTGVINGVPGGISPTPAAGSFLDLTLNGANTQVTLSGGTIAFPPLALTIQGGTIVNVTGAGVVFDAAPQSAALDAEGRAELLVSLSPATAADFSTFSVIVTSCSGPFCGILPILTLDMVRYRLFIDYDETYSSFTAEFIGQTSNNSILSIALSGVAPEIAVTDSVAPAADLLVPFGDVTELSSAVQTVTVTNGGTANLLLGAVADANPLAAPFSLSNDNCSGATVLPAATCTFDVTFSPGSVGAFSDSLDIPSSDADEPSVSVTVSGNGTAQPVPNISISDSVAPGTDQSVPFGTATIGTTVDQTVTVTNDGNGDLILFGIASDNGLLAPFSLVETCSGQTLPPAASCTFTVRFQPTGVGASNDTFDIPSNDGADPVVTVSVSGTGAAVPTPDIRVTDEDTPPPADADLLVAFGNVTETTLRDETITVSNVGNLDLVIGAIAGTNPLGAPFSVQADGCSTQTLAPAASCTLVVRYAPSTTGAASDSFNIPSNDPDEASVTVQVTGTGITEGEGGVPTPRPDGADGGFMAVDPATLLLFGAAGALGWRRRRA
ncbi:MAG: choice-of-anchor D domain-containing protein, partial [Armatimonadetes bacterium]|nr:choice-of-anchor D domain-containing protein [Armatimonadota bacterium]